MPVLGHPLMATSAEAFAKNCQGAGWPSVGFVADRENLTTDEC